MSAYDDLVMADVPTRYYPVNETAGTLLHDYSAGGFNTTCGAGYLNHPGLIPNDPDRGGRHLVTGYLGAMGHTTAMTYEFLYKCESIASGTRIFAARDTGFSQDLWHLRMDSANVNVFVRNAAGNYVSASVATLALNVRYHISLRISTTQIRLEVYNLDTKTMHGAADVAIVGLRTNVNPQLLIGTVQWNTPGALGYIQKIAYFESLISDSSLNARRVMAADGFTALPPWRLGSTQVTKMYLGSTPIIKRYLGSTQI